MMPNSLYCTLPRATLPLLRKLDMSISKVGRSYRGVYETFLECKLDPAYLAYIEAVSNARARLPLATAILCGAALESAVYMAVQDYRGDVGMLSIKLLGKDYYNWKNLKQDAKTIDILQNKDIRNADYIMKFRDFVHLGEKYSKNRLKTLVFMRDRKTQRILTTTEDLIVRVALNYIRAWTKYPGYSLKGKLYHVR